MCTSKVELIETNLIDHLLQFRQGLKYVALIVHNQIPWPFRCQWCSGSSIAKEKLTRFSHRGPIGRISDLANFWLTTSPWQEQVSAFAKGAKESIWSKKQLWTKRNSSLALPNYKEAKNGPQLSKTCCGNITFCTFPEEDTAMVFNHLWKPGFEPIQSHSSSSDFRTRSTRSPQALFYRMNNGINIG